MLVLAGLFFVFSSAAFAAPVGTVTAVQGKADITRGDDPARPVALDDEVFVGDFLRTKSGGRLEVTFIDGTVSRMSSRSRLRVTEFLFDAGKREGTLDLLRGKVRSVVAGASPDSTYEVHTPTAVCGVRGTQFIVTFQNGVTRGATVSGTVYTYSRSRPGEVRVMEAGQGFTLTDPDDAPQVQDIPEEDLQRDLDDTSMGGDGDDGDDGSGGTSGTVGDDLASGDDGTSGTTPPDGTTGGLDPGSDPNAPPAIPPEPEPEPIIPESPVGDGVLSGSVSDAYSSTSFDALFDMTALTGTITLSGTIKAPSDESGYGYSDPGWIVPLYFDNDTGTMDGMFAGKTGSWEGILSSILFDSAENLYYLFGLPAGDTATTAGSGVELGEGAGFATLTPAADMPEESSFGVVETESGSPYPLSVMIGENYSSYYSGSEGGYDYTSFYVDSYITLLDRTHRGYIEFAHDYYTYSEGGSVESDLYSDGSAYFYPHDFVGVVPGIDLSHEVWTNLPASLYANNGGTAAVAAHDSGLIGGTYAESSWGTGLGDYTAMGTYDGDLGSGNYLWNSFVAFADGAETGWTDLENVAAMLRGDSFQTSNLAFTFTTGCWLFNDPETNDTALYGNTVGIYMDESGNAGLVYGSIPGGHYYPGMNMWMADGANIEFDAQGAYTLEGIDINPLAGYLYEDFPGGTISGAGAGASIEFIIPGDIGIGWGAYNLMFGSDDLPFSYANDFSGNPGEVDVAFFGRPVLDEAAYLIGILGSSWYDGLVDGSISGIFVSDKDHGILGGPFYGTYDDADGTWVGASSGTFEETDTFDNLFSSAWAGPWVNLYSGYFKNYAGSSISGGSMPFYEAFVAGTDLGVWAFDVNELYDQYGEVPPFFNTETLPGGPWTLFGYVNEETFSRSLIIDGTQWNEGPDGIAGSVAGSWITIDKALTGVIGGSITGEIIDGTTTWQAIARGVSIGTERFLSMAGSDTGKAALGQMSIPCVQVGTTDLVQAPNGSQYLSGVYMNDVRFFSYSAGQAPVIWATGDVGGNWSGTPFSDYAILTGPGFEGAGVDFFINRWDSNQWAAQVSAYEGTVASHTIAIQGGAAGAYTGDTSGTFTGTASGVAGPPDLIGYD